MNAAVLFIMEIGVVIPAHVLGLLTSFGDVLIEAVDKLSFDTIMNAVTKHTTITDMDNDTTITVPSRIGYKVVIHREMGCHTLDESVVSSLFDELDPNTISMYITTNDPPIKPIVREHHSLYDDGIPF